MSDKSENTNLFLEENPLRNAAEQNASFVIRFEHINTSNMKIGGNSDETFGDALSRYMSDRNVTISELARLTGISEITIKRYRGKCYHDVVVEYVVAICVSLNLYIEQSLHLLRLAGKALNNSEKHRLFYFFLCICFNSSFTIKDCNLILEENGYGQLI